MNRILLLLALVAFGTNGLAQRNRLAPTSAAERLSVVDQRANSDAASWTTGLELRCVGPTVMSGRVVDIAVVAITRASNSPLLVMYSHQVNC